ncbi:MAG TPA: hypothetical protein VGV12_15830 [Gemmatimonadales bacterium]|nr:hypothetical protein [Gemmatimonadales bacterium]
MLDPEGKRSMRMLQLYLSPAEAAEFRDALGALLRDPEAFDHRHVIGDGREVSFSIITPAKLANVQPYTELERRVLRER